MIITLSFSEMDDHLATIDMGQNRHGPKIGGGCYAPFCEGSWVPI